jgi:UDP-N-acetylglucosamine 2-epimerase (non-hydrolysing)
MKKKVLVVFGTRPEAIKMAPVIREAQRHSDRLETKVCITGQHKEMLQQVLQFFSITPDFDLSLMKHNQTLFDITADVLKGIEAVLNEFAADYLLVQGDTTTAMAGALAGYYKKIAVCHVEAGLRSGDIYSPFPEEVNRRIVGTLCNFHFAPTPLAKENLQRENHKQNIFVTGNTVIDALLWGVEKVRENKEIAQQFSYLADGKKVILVTAHRRESFGRPFEDICDAVREIANANPAFSIVYPVHLNPNVQQVVQEKLSNLSNVYLIKPLDYPSLLWLMDRCYFVLTDSGGIQEEAPSLGKPVIVLRNVTERQEGIDAGTAVLVGTDKNLIVGTAQRLIDNDNTYTQMAQAVSPYGDGTASQQIISVLLNQRS